MIYSMIFMAILGKVSDISPLGLPYIPTRVTVSGFRGTRDDPPKVDFEEQAIGRCWRQGQKSVVHVWRLCMLGTVEEDFFSLEGVRKCAKTSGS